MPTTITGDTEIGSRIRLARKVRGWTQQNLADKLRCGRQWVYNLESGRAGTTSEGYKRLATALDVTLDYLMTGKLSAGGPELKGANLRLLARIIDKYGVEFLAALDRKSASERAAVKRQLGASKKRRAPTRKK